MQMKVFTLPYQASLCGFNDEPLREFLVDKEVLDIDGQFFVKDGLPHWTMLVRYTIRDRLEAAPVKGAKSGSEKEDWRKRLDKADWGLFNRLREWRAAQARDEGVPPYLIFTNKQLTELVLARPESLAAIGGIDGVGPSRVEKYGKPVLALLQNRERSEDVDREGKEDSGAPGTDGVDGISGMAADDDGQVSEESAVHPVEPD